MSFFGRLFTVGKAEAHAIVDKLEDPVKMAEQGIRDLKEQLRDAMEGLAKVKGQAIRSKREWNRNRDIATDYEKKAMLLLQRAQEGAIDVAEADRLATEALAKRDSAIERVKQLDGEVKQFDAMTGKLENNVNQLKSQISKWENELASLKARSQVSKATRKLNEQLAEVDSSSTISMLERMRTKVQEEESLAEAYGEMAQVDKSVDAEIDAALGGGSASSGSASLAALKAKMADKQLTNV